MNPALTTGLNLDRVQTAAALLDKTWSIADLQPLINAVPGVVDVILRALDLASVAARRRHTRTLTSMAHRIGGAAMRVLTECDSTTRVKRALFLIIHPQGATP